MPETLLIKTDFRRGAEWREAFAGFDVEVREWGAPGDPAEIDYALVWKPKPGALAAFPNLKIIFSIGAGIDHLLGEDVLPRGLPVVRMVERALTAGMTEYVLYHVLRFHRFMPQYEAGRREGAWREIPQTPAWRRRVGLLGLGVLGADAARALAALGFDVAGWSRGEKNIRGVASHHGARGLREMLARSEILVCLLPLTAQTENILNAETFAQLPKGAFVINAARGGHCMEEDLLAALESGHLAGAALDVFKTEPLEKSSPLWRHPRVYITPHIASMTVPATAAEHVMENIRRFRAGRELTHLADLAREY
ncbi:MAG: glyoxylate/hydroxypyruvate reductase A [Gammaproteobacteria bacterium]|nr:glyoxylate/hydroxypyruvate reductase A [Gammaproteobacteria bacterium]MDA7969350.1 glyoxylate/hydroxypyruvate reductase A [Gammaproteobacteria bacterium]MDA7971492.1 glyoxylate/hydroxypyruvate reductase A [Gammaproteobacteria bacterium]MDA7995350.1 glyoxylate/hydroxypyruvate reductase A [Gammaproteobacteria bacterium]MDA8023197.1 glyoxylate/hydroxypyruvate reductase A [Gammaproteobacteria bacterium]